MCVCHHYHGVSSESVWLLYHSCVSGGIFTRRVSMIVTSGMFAFCVVGFLGAGSKGLGCSWQPVRWWCSWIEEWHGAQPPWVPQGSHLAGAVWGLCQGDRRGLSLLGEPGLCISDLLLVLNHVHSIHKEKPYF